METTNLLANVLDDPTPDLDLEIIDAIHRGEDAYVGFMRKPTHPKFDKKGRPKLMENLFSIKISELRDTLPGYTGWLTHDSYMTVNSPYRAAPYLNKQTGLPDVWRKENQLRYLCAAYADLDVGRPDSPNPEKRCTWRYAAAAAGDLMDQGKLPQASIMAESGRGIYLLWLLQDQAEPGKPPRAYPEQISAYKEINRAITLRLKHLASDKGAIDASRVLRTPGSVHRTANKRVHYLIQADDKGQGFLYTLDELATFFGVPTRGNKLPAETRALAEGEQTPSRRTKKPGSAPNRRKGQYALHAKRAADLDTLEQHRGGFLKRGEKYLDEFVSCGRRLTLTYYAEFIQGSGATQHKVLDAVQTMAANCNPPYPSDPDDVSPADLVRGVYERTKKRRHRSKTLCDLFGVSDDLARKLDLKTIITETVRLERKEQKPSKSTIRANRRLWIRAHVDLWGLPKGGCRGMARLLKDHGFDAGHQTANADLNALGFKARR